MSERLLVYFRDLVAAVRPTDVADIVAAALVLAVLGLWMRRGAARRGVRNLIVLVAAVAAVYVAATRLDMLLLRTLAGVALGVLVAGAIVVFQTDLRRLVDRIGVLHLPRRAARPAEVADVLVEAAHRLVQARSGALVALRGRDPWDRYVEGGVALYGRPSVPLLLSIFDTSSPGHDGAVLVEPDGTLTRFGVHLPLALHLPEVSRSGGTRHAAALGLSEQCDALVMVVSEERGTLSVARHGVLAEVSEAGLREALDGFFREAAPEAPPAPVGRILRRALRAFTLALAAATLSWALFVYRPDTVYRTWTVPVEYRNVPPSLALDETFVDAVRVTLSGPEEAFTALKPADLAASFDLSTTGAGTHRLAVTARRLHLPPGLRLYRAEPATLRVTLHRHR